MSTVQRHALVVRLCHWLIAISGIVLLFSGFGQMPMYKRYNVIKLPGLAWSANYDITLLLHYLAGTVFTAAIVFHLLYHLRRKEFGIVPQKEDIRASFQGLLAMSGLRVGLRHGKFQAKQRVIYAIVGVTSLVLIFSGLVKSYKNIGPITLEPMLLQWLAFIHTIAGMFFMSLFLVHVAALLLRQHRPLIPSMFTGKLDADYADIHHPDWSGD